MTKRTKMTTKIVVKEIRSSLSIARSIIEDNVNSLDDYSSTTTTTGTSIDGHPITSTIRFECGRLKYSHVKEEWSIRHKNVDNMAMASSTSSSPLLQQYNSKTIASLWKISKSANNALDDDTNTNTNTNISSSKNISNNNHNTGTGTGTGTDNPNKSDGSRNNDNDIDIKNKNKNKNKNHNTRLK
mmetsp:Transcript_50716/g.57427  ORF Transcript_50716/g.57427 Transcript_50716/m.57427 type:complete len:185 (+) Transcript_50716:966-1520(+)